MRERASTSQMIPPELPAPAAETNSDDAQTGMPCKHNLLATKAWIEGKIYSFIFKFFLTVCTLVLLLYIFDMLQVYIEM